MNRPTLVWTIGRGGLLGQNLERECRRQGHTVWSPTTEKLSWLDRQVLNAQLTTNAQAFLTEAANPKYASWAILWAAGTGVVHTEAKDLQAETDSFQTFLDKISESLSSQTPRPRGTLFFASSAGAIYAQTREVPANEDSPPAPVSSYGRAKLEQEEKLRAFARHHSNVSTLIGRISNLYGPGQNLRKAQGILSHISRSILFRRTIHIYVPLDTVRDYLFVEDCAADILACIREISVRAEFAKQACHFMKIFSSEVPSTLSTILNQFRRITHHHPQVLCAVSPAARNQPRTLSFLSKVLPLPNGRKKVPLALGIARLHQANFELYLSGKLEMPR